MESHRIVVDGNPVAQPRVKATSIAGHIRIYTPGNANEFKSRIKAAVKEAGLRGRMFAQPLRVDIDMYFGRPKSHFRKKAGLPVLKPDAPVWLTRRPDKDNLEKAVLDAMTAVGVYKDDSFVVTGGVSKRYVNDEFPEPTTVIKISCL